MKKQINQGAVIGILIVVALVVVVWGWKALAPPAPAAINSFDKASLKVMSEKHAASAQEMQDTQSKLFEQAHGGGH